MADDPATHEATQTTPDQSTDDPVSTNAKAKGDAEELTTLRTRTAEQNATIMALKEQIDSMQEQWKDTLMNPETIRRMGGQADPEPARSSSGAVRVPVSDDGTVDLTSVLTALESKLNKSKTDTPETRELRRQLDNLQAHISVSEAKSKYDDFDEYRERMSQLARAKPGLTASEYYALAKFEDLHKSESELKQLKQGQAMRGSNQASGTDASPNVELEKAIAGKEGTELTRALADLLDKGMSIE
jgi:small-conductance mechanosensitive channel